MWIFLILIQFASADVRVISQAHDKFLAEGRASALRFLSSQISVVKPEAKSALVNEGDRLANRFLTDRAQRDFELATSTLYSKGLGSRELFEKALAVEPDNLQILLQLLLLDLKEDHCSIANERIATIRGVWKHYNYLPYLQLLVKFCEKEIPSLSALKTEPWPSDVRLYVQQLEIRTLVELGRGAEAIQLGRKIRDENLSYAEPMFWTFRAGQIETEGNIELLRKYIAMCDSYAEVDRRRHQLDPFLCSNLNEAKRLLRAEEASL